MPSKTTLNAKNLEALGAKRLAELLIELSTGNAAAKRRLRLELAGATGTGDVVRELRKRLTAIARSRSFVDWQKRRALVKDLDTQRRAIVEQVAKADPAEALDLIWRFLGLATSVFDRCDDSSGTVVGVFDQAARDLGAIAAAAQPDPERLAGDVARALSDNDYGQYDDLIGVLTPALGPDGLQHLRSRMLALSGQPVERPPEAERQVVGYGSGAPVYADEMEERSRLSTVRLALMDIADAQGDVDAFIAQYDEPTRKVPKIAAEIARRLLAAGRTEEAWQAIEAAEPRSNNGRVSLSSAGRTPASRCSRRWAGPRRRRPRGGPASSRRSRRSTSEPTSSGCLTSRMWKRRSVRSTTPRPSGARSTHSRSWSPGRRSIGRPPWCSGALGSSTATTTRS